MSLSSRVLPRDQYVRLVGTYVEDLAPLMRPDDGEVLVVERDGVIVGAWVLLRVWHAECLWVDPEERRHVSVLRRLWKALCQRARELNARTVCTSSDRDEIASMLQRFGATVIPGTPWVLPLERKD